MSNKQTDVWIDDAREWINNSSYEGLLERWRNAPAGDPIFQGEIGQYYSDVMEKKKAEVGHDEAVKASKSIGWVK